MTTRAPRVAVAAPSRAAADAGARIGAEGGGAVDAAVAAMLVSLVTEPGIVSLAGGAFATVLPGPGQPPVTVDGYVEMPGRGLPPEAFGRGLRQLVTSYGGHTEMTVGHGSVATPGVLRWPGRAPDADGAAIREHGWGTPAHTDADESGDDAPSE